MKLSFINELQWLLPIQLEKTLRPGKLNKVITLRGVLLKVDNRNTFRLSLRKCSVNSYSVYWDRCKYEMAYLLHIPLFSMIWYHFILKLMHIGLTLKLLNCDKKWLVRSMHTYIAICCLFLRKSFFSWWQNDTIANHRMSGSVYELHFQLPIR